MDTFTWRRLLSIYISVRITRVFVHFCVFLPFTPFFLNSPSFHLFVFLLPFTCRSWLESWWHLYAYRPKPCPSEMDNTSSNWPGARTIAPLPSCSSSGSSETITRRASVHRSCMCSFFLLKLTGYNMLHRRIVQNHARQVHVACPRTHECASQGNKRCRLYVCQKGATTAAATPLSPPPLPAPRVSCFTGK